MNKICILGSINMDLVINVPKMPSIGETILAKKLKQIPGGKGANQAIAAARANAIVSMIGKVGNDENGKLLKELVGKDRIDNRFIYESLESSTGIAIITVNSKSDNSIIVVSGANMNIKKSQIDEAIELLKESNILIAQFEVSMEIIEYTFKLMKKMNNKITILNPAPAKNISDKLLKYTDILVPNETEIEVLTNIKVVDLESAKQAANVFLNRGVKFVIITLGENGAALISKKRGEIIAGYKVKAVDTTAAGDTFIGVLSTRIKQEELTFDTLKEAIRFAHKASSIAVQKEGAQPSIPNLKEIENVYN
ncbi:MAG: ribokinase [Paraclostridium sp.]|uniref:ribokinase n=1 Tax=Paraclostridium sp. TaxID=2023273 RepID=UPI003F33990D